MWCRLGSATKQSLTQTIMLNSIKSRGYEIENDPKQADIIIVNTCAFIEAARKESIDTIFQMSEYKSDKCKKLIITGCLPRLYPNELFDELTEADSTIIAPYSEIGAILDKLNDNSDRQNISLPVNAVENSQRVLTTPSHYAYLKIADGCDNFCTYCTIPYIRGRYRSRRIEDVVEEAKSLVANGVVELILVAQDVTRYGTELYKTNRLLDLLKELTKIEDLRWIRLLYCYPELVGEDLLEFIENNPKVCKYIDIPLQHVNGEILKKMNRRSTSESIIRLFDLLHDKYPDVNVRSTFICGFPNESQQAHNDIADFLAKYKLANVGFFAYSQEENTPAATMDGQIDEETKRLRVEDLYALQANEVEDNLSSLLGQELEVIIDAKLKKRANGCNYLGRTQFQSPDIDGVTYVNSVESLKLGSIVKVKITKYIAYDLIGEKL